MQSNQKDAKAEGMTAAYTLNYQEQANGSEQSQQAKEQQSEIDQSEYRVIRQKRIAIGMSLMIIKYDNGVKQQWMDTKMVQNLRQNIQFTIISDKIYVTKKAIYLQDITGQDKKHQSQQQKKHSLDKVYIHKPILDKKQLQKLKQYQLIKYQQIINNFNLKSLFQMIVQAIDQFNIKQTQIQSKEVLGNPDNDYFEPKLSRYLLNGKFKLVLFNFQFKRPFLSIMHIKLKCSYSSFQNEHLLLLYSISQIPPVFDQLQQINEPQQIVYRIPGSFKCNIIPYGQCFLLQKMQNPTSKNNLKLQQFVFLTEIPLNKSLSSINDNKEINQNQNQKCLHFYQFQVIKFSGSFLCGIVSNAERANQYQSSAKSIHSIYYGLRTGNKGAGGMQQPCGRPVKQGTWVKVSVDIAFNKVRWYNKVQLQNEYQLLGEANIPKWWIKKDTKTYFNLQMSRIGDQVKIKM